MNLTEQIQNDLKQAQLSRDEIKVSTLRMLLSEINYAKIAQGQDLTDQDILKVIQKEIKKRRESIEAFKQGNRPELAQKETAEAEILTSYLPAQLSDEELLGMVGVAMEETRASTMADFGKVMGKVMSQAGSKADSVRVSEIIKQKMGVETSN